MISVSLVEDDNDQEGVTMGAGRPRANSYSPLMSHNNNGGEDIVCSTGELVSLKCLSRSAVEMRALQNNEFPESVSWGPAARRGSLFYGGGIGNNNHANHQRSQSFDAAIGKKSPGAKSNLFSGLFNRIKVGVGVGSSVAASSSISPSNEMMDGSSGSSSKHATAPPTTPVASSTVFLVDPCGCGPTITTLSPIPVTTSKSTMGGGEGGSQDRSPVSGEKTERGKGGIPWDNNTGYFLDASVLGLAIENHLKKGDGQKRRATFCTLSETNSQLLGQPSAAGATLLGAPNNRPRSASAYSVLPFLHSSGGGPATTGDPDLISRRRESIATAFPTSTSPLGFFQHQGRRNSSFNPTANNEHASSPSTDNYSPQEDVIVGSFIKTSMTSELYSEGEVIMEEEQLDIENYDRQMPQNISQNQQRTSSTSFLKGIDFWAKKPTETIINLFSSNSANYIPGSSNGDGKFSFSTQHSRGSVVVATINEEEEDGGNNSEQQQEPQPRNTICGFLRNVIMQILNSFFRS